jgi:hypothetical protein
MLIDGYWDFVDQDDERSQQCLREMSEKTL